MQQILDLRIQKEFNLSSKDFNNLLLDWVAENNTVFTYLNSNQHIDSNSSFDVLCAFGVNNFIEADFNGAFDKLGAFKSQTKDWLFGYLGYDLKNDLENLESNNYDGVGFKDLFFFQPKKIVSIVEDKVCFNYLETYSKDIEKDFESILNFSSPTIHKSSLQIQNKISKEKYLNKIEQVKTHIFRGDIYEMNFCQEFYVKDAEIHPLSIYKSLNSISNAPFSSFIRVNDKYVISSSPERYLKKKGSTIISQPIKGTAKRDKDSKKDFQLKETLRNCEKERSENIMIVDLVRNDLSLTAKKGSVNVEELCEIYSFEQVHQMISTVKSEILDNVDSIDVLKTTFPMGSMTGAPKISAMKIIEELESTKRGVYSGAIGYFTPNDDFDFNVVIRSILYNSKRKYLSFSVGSAITSKSSAESEYNECFVKANALIKVLTQL